MKARSSASEETGPRAHTASSTMDTGALAQRESG